MIEDCDVTRDQRTAYFSIVYAATSLEIIDVFYISDVFTYVYSA